MKRDLGYSQSFGGGGQKLESDRERKLTLVMNGRFSYGAVEMATGESFAFDFAEFTSQFSRDIFK